MKSDYLSFLLAEGIVKVNETVNPAPYEKIVECAAPLLRSIMITQLTGLDITIDKVAEVSARWLISSAIKVCTEDDQDLIYSDMLLCCTEFYSPDLCQRGS